MGKHNIRSSGGDPLGSLGDLGWYNVRFGLFAFGYDCPPVSVSARKIRDVSDFSGNEGVPADMEVNVYFNEAKSKVLSFHCSFCHPFRQWIEVVGQNYALRLDDFVLPKKQSESTFTIERNAGLMDMDCMVTTVEETATTFGCVQEIEMIKTFSSIATGDMPQDPFWPSIILKTQRVMDAALLSASNDGATVAL